MARLAILNESMDAVANCIVGNPEDFPDAIDVTGQRVSKGWAYDGAEFFPPKPEPKIQEPELYLLLSATGGDGLDPIGLPKDGTSPLKITGELKDPLGNPVNAVDGSAWRVSIRSASGEIRDVVRVVFAGNQISMAYVPENSMLCGIYNVDEKDFAQVPDGSGGFCKIRLHPQNPFTFKIYRDLSA
jgi:hypothetical protein